MRQRVHDNTLERELARAVARGACDEAWAAWEAMEGSAPDQALGSLAELCLGHQQWDRAHAAYQRMASLDPSQRMKRRLAGNLAGLRVHRPAVHDILCRAPDTGSGRYQIARAANGQHTVVYHGDADRRVVLTSMRDPQAHAREALTRLGPACGRGEAVTASGMGDGWLMRLLAHEPPALRLGMELPVYLIEPDPAAVTNALLLHDFTGEAGPIQHPRFHWFVGAHWADALRAAMEREDHLPGITTAVAQSPHAETITRGIHDAIRAREQVSDRLKARVEAYYDTLTREHLVQLLGPAPPRPPRVLVLTSRFTTVLQYSSRDAADALEALGWRARVEIEHQAHHRASNHVAVRRALDQWKPDVVLVLDHLRREYHGAFPPSLPFVCWIQDHLANLTTKAAGESITPRDFVLTSIAPLYTGLYGYPRRQCVAVSKLTRVPRRPAKWSSDGDDLIYVSHASQPPRQIAEQLLQECGGHAPGRRVMEVGGERILRLYERGGSLATLQEVSELVDAVEDEHAPGALSPELRYRLADALFTRLNNALYRQQALGWAADAAEQMGLRLAIHGLGWDAHPRFAPYARGPIQYGDALEKLTRASRINLQIVPYFCLHQRLLDGLVAGGFFLVRAHPTDTLLPALGRFLDAHFPPEVQSLAQARRAAEGPVRERLEEELERCKVLTDLGTPIDPIQWVRGCQRARLLGDQDRALPRLEEVSFDGPEALGDRIGRFLHDDALRAKIAGRQRAAIEHRLSYTAGMERVMGQVRELLAAEPDPPAPGSGPTPAHRAERPPAPAAASHASPSPASP